MDREELLEEWYREAYDVQQSSIEKRSSEGDISDACMGIFYSQKSGQTVSSVNTHISNAIKKTELK